jgi:glycosyltransferase involved in cell wall biosynthesis
MRSRSFTPSSLFFHPRQEKQRSVLYLSVFDPHVPLSGSGVRGAEFVNTLAERFHVDLIYMDGAGHPPLQKAARQFASRIQETREKTQVPFSRSGYFLFSPSLYRRAAELLRRKRYDLMVCDYGLSAVYGLLLSGRFGTPFVYCSHNVEHQLYWDKAKRDKRRLLLVPWVYLVERLGVSHSDILVSITPEDAGFYARWKDGENILCIPQGFDESVFNPFYEAPRNEPKIVLFCGNFNIGANREVVERVLSCILPRVLAVHPGTMFRFIGANPPEDVRHPNIEFTGFVPDYVSHLKQADVVISPMGHGRGFPTKIVEALACGKPTVATAVGCRSLERDYHSLCVSGIGLFPEIINKLLTRDKPVMGADYEKLKSRYSWRRNIAKLIDGMERSIDAREG